MKPLYTLIIILAILLLIIAVIIFVAPQLTGQAAGQKRPGCIAVAGLPDSGCTPGAVFNVTTAEICVSGYTKTVRNVSQTTKEEVYREYGITHRDPYEYQVDHLIPLELGGSNDISNLWPQAREPRPGYNEKTSAGNLLHDLVCDGKIPLEEAQRLIAENWTAVWVRIK